MSFTFHTKLAVRMAFGAMCLLALIKVEPALALSPAAPLAMPQVVFPGDSMMLTAEANFVIARVANDARKNGNKVRAVGILRDGDSRFWMNDARAEMVARTLVADGIDQACVMTGRREAEDDGWYFSLPASGPPQGRVVMVVSICSATKPR